MNHSGGENAASTTTAILPLSHRIDFLLHATNTLPFNSSAHAQQPELAITTDKSAQRLISWRFESRNTVQRLQKQCLSTSAAILSRNLFYVLWLPQKPNRPNTTVYIDTNATQSGTFFHMFHAEI